MVCGPGPDPADGLRGSEVELCLRGSASLVAVARAVVSDLSMRADFDLDSIDDLKIAVDEACSQLLTVSVPGAPLRCRFHVDSSAMRVVVSTSSTVPVGGGDSFGWHVLRTVSDEVWADNEPGNDGANLSSIGLLKHRRDGSYRADR